MANAVYRIPDAGLDAALAEILLPVPLDFTGADSRTAEPLARAAAFSGMAAARRLATGDFAVGGCVDLRIFLGDVELLVVAAMDLSHAGREFSARLRNAIAGLRRLHSIRAGVVRVEKCSLVARAGIETVNRALSNGSFPVKKMRTGFPLPARFLVLFPSGMLPHR